MSNLRITLTTVDDLIKYLSNPELRYRPLSQVITVTVRIGRADADIQDVYFNQIDKFTWNHIGDELEIEV